MKRKISQKLKHLPRKWKLGSFSSNFFAVVLGIVITFIGNDLIIRYNDSKEVSQALILLKNELVSNREEIFEIAKRVELEQRSAQYLLQYKGRMSEAPRDSVNKYASLPFQWVTILLSTDAFEMFKASSMIQKMGNVDLSYSIFQAYDAIRHAELSFDGFSRIKMDLQKSLSNNPQLNELMAREDLDIVQTWDLVLKYPEGLSLIKQIPEIQNSARYYTYIEIIDRTIDELNALEQ